MGGVSQPHAGWVGPDMAMALTAGTVLATRCLFLLSRQKSEVEDLWYMGLTLANLAGTFQDHALMDAVQTIIASARAMVLPPLP